MNKKILAVAIAAAIAAPLTPMVAQADLKLKGTVQAEFGNHSNDADGGDDEMRNDGGSGAMQNGGPNALDFKFEENFPNGGLTAFGTVGFVFNTSTAGGLSDRDTFVGLKGSNAHFAIGRKQGLYKTVNTGFKNKSNMDPFYGTGIQTRNSGGGQTGGSPFSHSSRVNDVLEFGFKGGDFSAGVQYVADEQGNDADGSFLVSARYDNKKLVAYAAYASMEPGGDADNLRNIQLGVQSSFGGLKIGLQYEDAEMGTLSGNEGKYLLGTLAYRVDNVTVATWIGAFEDDVLEDNDSALSYSVGAKYHFSKRTFAYGGYHKTDGDTGLPEWSSFLVGLRHKF
ncbi:MAG: porin [Gammaproteobacteria bacterium]|nr:porin [Gammaproteobacteria bacterium]